jgi:uncharacterized protein
MLKTKKNKITNEKLPQFPDFENLDAKHQALINEHTRHGHLYSDFNFMSLWSWDHQNKLMLSQLNDNLVIKFQDYLDPEQYFYSFFGTHAIDKTALTLLEASHTEGIEELKLIPEFVVEKIKRKSKFIITEDRDSFDYIVAIKDMIELPGPHNESKRWSMRQLEKNHKDKMSVRELNIRSPEIQDHMLNLLKEWEEQMQQKASFSTNELKAVKKMIKEHHTINNDKLHVVGIYLDNVLRAFSVSELIDEGFAMGHYKKSDRAYRGLGVALDHYTAKTLHAKGISHINHEQDLGIEGLRHAKMASNPVYFLKKYTIALRT